MTFNEVTAEIEARTGIKRNLSRRVLKELGAIIQEKVPQGEKVSVPGVVTIGFGYTPPRRKGEEYAGFGGEIVQADKARPEKLRVTVNYPGGKPKLLPKKGTKGYKKVIAEKRG